MTKRRKAQCFNPVLGKVCEACSSWFETVQGVMTHQLNSKNVHGIKKANSEPSTAQSKRKTQLKMAARILRFPLRWQVLT